MSFGKPYKRIWRPHPGTICSDYLTDDRWVTDATDYIRAYRLLQSDLVATFDYVEPVENNKATYSHRFYQLLTRACIEFEANACAVLLANGYSKTGNLNITDYWKLEQACRLSEYAIKIPTWMVPARPSRHLVNGKARHGTAL